jgi:PAS domain-containing protein
VLTGAVVRLTSRIGERSQTLEAANVRIGELQTSDRRGHAIDAGSQRIEALATECALVLLDRQGQIVEWRAGAERLYGHPATAALGTSAATLFGGANADAMFRALLADAARASSASACGEHRRADASVFDADVELLRAGDGFVMVVRDRTPEQQRQRTAAQAAGELRALRDEADLAQRQLATLQSVTDPSLNAWPPSHFVAELLERVRIAVNADGIALVLMKGLATPRLFSTVEGLHPQGLANKRMPDLSATSAARIAFVQNDAARVVEESLLLWPDGISSLIAVPVVHAGDVEGIIEVVDRRGRRSTEWEIALVQVVAARVAGLARDHGYADTAVA